MKPFRSAANPQEEIAALAKRVAPVHGAALRAYHERSGSAPHSGARNAEVIAQAAARRGKRRDSVQVSPVLILPGRRFRRPSLRLLVIVVSGCAGGCVAHFGGVRAQTVALMGGLFMLLISAFLSLLAALLRVYVRVRYNTDRKARAGRRTVPVVHRETPIVHREAPVVHREM